MDRTLNSFIEQLALHWYICNHFYNQQNKTAKYRYINLLLLQSGVSLKVNCKELGIVNDSAVVSYTIKVTVSGWK